MKEKVNFIAPKIFSPKYKQKFAQPNIKYITNVCSPEGLQTIIEWLQTIRKANLQTNSIIMLHSAHQKEYKPANKLSCCKPKGMQTCQHKKAVVCCAPKAAQTMLI